MLTISPRGTGRGSPVPSIERRLRVDLFDKITWSCPLKLRIYGSPNEGFQKISLIDIVFDNSRDLRILEYELKEFVESALPSKLGVFGVMDDHRRGQTNEDIDVLSPVLWVVSDSNKHLRCALGVPYKRHFFGACYFLDFLHLSLCIEFTHLDERKLPVFGIIWIHRI